MRKTIVFLLFLCFQLAVQAQTTYRYWFDIDESSMQEGVSNVDEWQMDIDVNDLTENIHQLHLQIADKDGTWSTIHTHWFVKAPSHASHGMYWFDENDKEMHRSDVLNGRFDIDVSMLTDGIHILTYQVRDTKNRPSAQYRTIFLIIPTPTKSKVHYWVDDESEKMQTFAYNGNTHILDLTGVSDGFHILHVQAEDISPSSPMTKLFIKIPQTEGVEKLLCLCSIDGETVKQEEVTNHDGVLNWSLDVSDITQGFHHILVQVITNSGAGSSLYEGFFLRDFTSAEMSSLKCVFSIDGEPHRTMAGSRGGDVFHFDLDVADIKDGLHNITYMLVGDNGVCTKSNSAFFWKTPLGGNGVAQYNYWLNDQTEKHEVVLKERTNPYNLITLLPVDKMPVRSSCFEFKVENGTPVIYAKNDIHFEFIDASGFVNVANAQYVDPTVSKSIEGITALLPTQTFARPEENGIKWFEFDAAPGDTIGFKSSQATSLQVFAPSGKEVFSASGDKSVKYNGAHTWEEGTYYVAVHDVTGSKPNVTLDYMHMDRYDVVDQDVRVVGNGGCSTITFQGNGFKDLYAVDLKDSKGNIIESIDVGHESDATTTVTFDFTGAKLGKYNAVFHFTEDDKRFLNSITVEEAKDIELATTVTYPSTFLRGTSVTYTVNITNKGNMTAYFVPIEVILSTHRFSNISSISFMDLNGKSLDKFSQDILEQDSVDVESLTNFAAEVNQIAGLLSFTIVQDNENDDEIGFCDRYITIPPLSSISFSTEIRTSDEVELYVTTPSNWFATSTWDEPTMRKKAPSEGVCCEKEKWECISNNLSDAIGLIAPPGLGCALSVADLGVNAAFEIMCANGNSPVDKLRSALKIKSASLSQKLFWAVLDCLSFGLSKKIDSYKRSREAFELSRQKYLQNSVENHNLYHQAMEEYDKLMYKAEDLYRQGKISEAEKLESEAKSLKFDADMLKISEEKSLEEAQKLQGKISDLNRSIDQCKADFAQIINKLKSGLKALQDNILCTQERLNADKSCNKPRKKRGGNTRPVNSYDPNDIYGYIAPSGSMFVGEDVVNLPYRIEFENDTTFATSAAHKVIVKDTLNAKVFDLSTFQSTSIKIGDKDVQLKGEKEFVTTVDMRPEINAIAQVEGLYDEKKGIATWQFTSLDPMTMEPTDDIMQGFLPVNYDGSGIGEVAYNINRKAGLSDGTAISNKASIVFDNNDAIETPTWTNIIDAIPPVTHVSDVEQVNDTIVRVHFDGDDNRSGVWKYSLYVQYGENTAWNEVAELDTTCCDFRFYEDIDYGFCVVATDMAGNVEKKVIQREYKFINGVGEMIDGISSPKTDQVATSRAYDLSGRLIQEEGYRGIVIKNKKKRLKR